MKVVILAGGLGSRLAEETHLKPKPMVEIGGRPILWHIMKLYHSHGLSDFIICCGFRGYVIKEYFANYALHMSDMTFDTAANTVQRSMAIAPGDLEPLDEVHLRIAGQTSGGGNNVRHIDQSSVFFEFYFVQ